MHLYFFYFCFGSVISLEAAAPIQQMAEMPPPCPLAVNSYKGALKTQDFTYTVWLWEQPASSTFLPFTSPGLSFLPHSLQRAFSSTGQGEAGGKWEDAFSILLSLLPCRKTLLSRDGAHALFILLGCGDTPGMCAQGKVLCGGHRAWKERRTQEEKKKNRVVPSLSKLAPGSWCHERSWDGCTSAAATILSDGMAPWGLSVHCTNPKGQRHNGAPRRKEFLSKDASGTSANGAKKRGFGFAGCALMAASMAWWLTEGENCFSSRRGK